MKKWLLILGITTCFLSLTACGAKEVETQKVISEEEASTFGQQLIDSLNMVIEQDAVSQYPPGTWEGDALASWISALEDMGSYQGIIGSTAEIGATEATINVEVKGSERDATMSIFLTAETIQSVTTTVKYSLGELMINAALNTVLGMGTTFSILILISLIISAMTVIPRIQAMFGPKSEDQKDITYQAIDNAIEQIIQKEELVDDHELVAVIAAAIAASEGAASTDGFRVRSIRRADTRKWREA